MGDPPGDPQGYWDLSGTPRRIPGGHPPRGIPRGDFSGGSPGGAQGGPPGGGPVGGPVWVVCSGALLGPWQSDPVYQFSILRKYCPCGISKFPPGNKLRAEERTGQKPHSQFYDTAVVVNPATKRRSLLLTSSLQSDLHRCLWLLGFLGWVVCCYGVAGALLGVARALLVLCWVAGVPGGADTSLGHAKRSICRGDSPPHVVEEP